MAESGSKTEALHLRPIYTSQSPLFARKALKPSVFLPFLITTRPITVNLQMQPTASDTIRSKQPNLTQSPQLRFAVMGKTVSPKHANREDRPKTQRKVTSSVSADTLRGNAPRVDCHRSENTVRKAVETVVVLRREKEVSPVRNCVNQVPGLFYEVRDDCAAEVSGQTYLLTPVYRGRPHTVLFQYPPQCNRPPRTSPRVISALTSELALKPLHYSRPEFGHIYTCIQSVLHYNGFTETEDSDFTLYLSSDITPKILLDFDPYQRYNHHPGSWQLGRKDNLWRNISHMRRLHGSEYDFCPMTFLLPEDFPRFQREREVRPSELWILKPSASACGRGIRVLSNKSKIKNKPGYLISHYISNPHLLNGRKYDLRLYVCVPSYDPLRIYLYKEGLVRFCTEEYTTAKTSVSQRYVHLTNYSVNKHGATYRPNHDTPAEDKTAHKWSHSVYRARLIDLGIDPEPVFARIKDLIVKTIIAGEPAIVNAALQYTRCRGVCFETYGFDVLLDDTLRPWLMEVNVSPSLNSNSPLDKRIKTALIADIYTLLGFIPCNREILSQEAESQKQSRIFGLSRRPKRPTLQAIAECRSLQELELDEGEVTMLMEAVEEQSRLGLFECLFPLRENVERYGRFLETTRVNNQLLWRLLQEPEFLQKYQLGPVLRV